MTNPDRALLKSCLLTKPLLINLLVTASRLPITTLLRMQVYQTWYWYDVHSLDQAFQTPYARVYEHKLERSAVYQQLKGLETIARRTYLITLAL